MMMTPHSSPPSTALPLLLLLVTLLVTLPSSASKRTASQKARNRARISQLRFGKLHSKVKEAAAPNRSALVGNYDGLCWDAAVFGDTDYPLTRRQCRRAVVTSGNVELMQDGGGVLERLRLGDCLRVVVMGGSITYGFNAMAHKKADRGVAWPEHWRRKLNSDHADCRPRNNSMATSDNGRSGHVFETLAVRGVGSSYWWQQLTTPGSNALAALSAEADVVVVETATNDVESEAATARLTELLVRRLRMLAPKAALIWLTAG